MSRKKTSKKQTESDQSLTDEQVVEKVVSGDSELYRELVLRYEAPLIRYAKSIVYEHEAAQDVVQNTFIKAYRNLKGFNTKLKFSSWIYRITHNEAVDHLKKYSKELRPDDEDWMGRQMDTSELVDETLQRKADKQLIIDQLAKLDVKYREPLTLSAIEGKSYQEICDILRIPSATVGTRINRAKEKLKRLVEIEKKKERKN